MLNQLIYWLKQYRVTSPEPHLLFDLNLLILFFCDVCVGVGVGVCVCHMLAHIR